VVTAENTTAPDTSNRTFVKEVAAAIRMNGLEQIQEDYIRYDYEKGEIVGACAIGQAAVNLGGIFREQPDYLERQLNQVVLENHPLNYWECPRESCGGRQHLGQLITHLNDYHFWTFEEIADWLDSISE